MKILLIAPMPDQGGPKGGMGSVTENMLHFLENNKQIVQLSFYNTLHKIRPITSSSFPVRIFTGVLNSLKTYFAILFILRNDRPELIHLASSASFALIKDYLISNAARRRKIPVVMHWHFGRVPELAHSKNWEWSLFTKVIRNCSLSIVIDPKSLETLRQHGFSNVLYIPNSMAPDIEEKAKEQIQNYIDHRDKDKILFVGHVIKDKGVYELVETCSKLPSIKELMLVGSFSEEIKDDLMALAAKNGKESWLKFTGQQNKEQVLEIMGNAPVLVLPSYTEGFPMVIVEAMAMGCAVIATDVGAIPEMLAVSGDKPCGICIPPRNMDKLEEAILSLINNFDYMETLGKRGIERVLNTYTHEQVNNEYLKVWNRAINERNIICGSLMN
jgi:glycosyltransferase involved in cell wall biosynthesis